MLIDCHAHLDDKKFSKDLDKVIEKAKNSGVKIIINNGTNPETNRTTLQLAKKYKIIYPALAIHPTHIHEFSDSEIEKELKFIKSKKPIAIGETGLDYLWIKKVLPREIGIKKAKKAGKEKQRQIAFFKKHILLANELNIPVICHSRWAVKRVCEILTELHPKKAILHGFSGSLTQAQEMISLGYKISISTNILYSEYTQCYAKHLPLEALLTETDCPYLFRKNNKTARNEPANIKLVIKELAKLKKISEKKVEQAIQASFKSYFKLNLTL